MNTPKRILCIMDLATVGRCSLAVAMPILSACKAQCCPLPATVLSSHTGGFKDVQQSDLSVFCNSALANFQKENIEFDAIYIGYLANEQQFLFAEKVLQHYHNAFVLVDPAMADNGRLYSSLPQDTPRLMLNLCGMASLISPNQTEADLLLKEKGVDIGLLGWEEKAAELSGGLRSVLITGVKTSPDTLTVYGYDNALGKSFYHNVPYVNMNYPGTGDIFASAVLGQVLGQKSLHEAVTNTCDFLSTAIVATHVAKADPRHGIWFEQFLHMLY